MLDAEGPAFLDRFFLARQAAWICCGSAISALITRPALQMAWYAYRFAWVDAAGLPRPRPCDLILPFLLLFSICSLLFCPELLETEMMARSLNLFLQAY